MAQRRLDCGAENVLARRLPDAGEAAHWRNDTRDAPLLRPACAAAFDGLGHSTWRILWDGHASGYCADASIAVRDNTGSKGRTRAGGGASEERITLRAKA